MNVTNILFIVGIVLLTAIVLCYHFRYRIRKYLHKLSFKMQLGTLRTAIHDADKDKAETDRKNIVVFNSTANIYEPVQKRMLKFVAKNKTQKKVANGFKQPKAYVKRNKSITLDRIKEVEKKSLYVTN